MLVAGWGADLETSGWCGLEELGNGGGEGVQQVFASLGTSS